jgi:hypothetical protein
MSLLALIKKGGLRGLAATATPATSATDKAASTPSVATVATVAVATAKNKGAKGPPAAQGSDREAIKESSPNVAHGGGSSCTQAGAKDAKAPARDIDLYCWPHSSAMNTAEIDGFSLRAGRFAALGLTQADAEALADGLVHRDRDHDERRTCLECQHLYGRGRWRCSNWRQAGSVPVQMGTAMAVDLVRTLQRCNGFAPALSIGKFAR